MTPTCTPPPSLRASPRIGFALLAAAALSVAPASGQTGGAAGPGSAPAAAGGDQEVPDPASVIGFEPGADFRLATYGQVRRYFEALARASDRVRLERIGETTLGKPMVLAFVSSAENLDRLDEIRATSRRLATDGELRDERARTLARRGKAVVWIDGGLHSTEVAGHQFPPVFAHRLATDESAEARRIREDVVVMLMPSLNPDGQDIVVDWYRENLGTPFETAELPWLYHEYVGHDNNRDWFMLTQPESRAAARQLWHRWYPQIVVNHHQESPFPGRIFIPPFADPVNPNIPTLVTTGINVVGTAMHQRFAERDMPGAVSRVGFTQWWNGGMRTAPYFHNQVGILTEVALHEYATPHHYEPDSLPERFRSGLAADRPSTWYPDPWEGGWWRLRDAVEYMVTASMAAADVASRRKDAWLFDTHRMARRAVEAGRSGDPYAYVIPVEGQHDPGETIAMLEVLRRGGVRLHRATSSFEAGGAEYPAGTYVAYAGQPYRAHLMDMLEPQHYPHRQRYPGGPPVTPYDLAGWTLPIQMGVEVERLDRPFRAETEPVEATDLPGPEGRVAGSADASRHLLDPAPTASARAVNALLEGGASVSRTASGFRLEGRDWPAGTFVVSAADAELLRRVAGEAGVTPVAAGRVPVETRALDAPRVGLYMSWEASMDAGWTRWVFDRYGFGYDTLRDADLREGDLSGYDVVLLPDQDEEDILNGHPEGTMPPEYVGGVGAIGAAELERFVRDGGTLVTLDDASGFAIRQLGLPVRDPVADVPRREFFIPGSLVRLRVDPEDPLGYGVQPLTAASFVRSGAFRPVPPASARDRAAERVVDVAARYGSGDVLLSGFALGADRHLADEAALVRLPLGEGQVVMFGFRPQFRGQPRATFQLLFNALYASTMGPLPYASLER